MRLKLIGACAMLAGLAVAGPASAQPSTSANPNYGTVTLRTGFTPDPRTVRVTSGGAINANSVGGNCSGFISRAPDVRLNFTAGSLPLIISAASSADTTLVINDPNGRWHCDDDGGVNGLNPSVRFNNARSGRYEIWIGSYQQGTNSRATLHISEVRSQ